MLFQIKANVAFIWKSRCSSRKEERRIHGLWSPVETCAVFDDLGWHVLCWCWWWLVHCVLSSPNSAVTYQEIVEHFMLQSDFFFHQDLASDQTVCWIGYYWAWRANQFIWPEAHGESMEYFKVGDEKHPTPKYRRAEDFYQSNLCFSNTSVSMS